MITLNAGGVPEHFNLPWKILAERQSLKVEGIHLNWREMHGGTGQMTAALESGELDIAVLLTEGIVTHIANGGDATIVQFYVNSPLIWGIYSHKDHHQKSWKEFDLPTYAISRIGSGSDIMARLHAHEHGKSITDDQLLIVDKLEGGLQALSIKEADLFYWEKYSTAPFLREYHLTKLGEYPTPWPCFVIATNTDMMSRYEPEIKAVLKAINRMAAELQGAEEDTIRLISNRYGLEHKDTVNWFSQLEWNVNAKPNDEALLKAIAAMKQVGLMNRNTSEDLHLYRNYLLDDTVLI